MRGPASRRSPLIEATCAAVAWIVVAPLWYGLESLFRWGELMPFQIAVGMLPWLVGVTLAAFALRFISAYFYRSRAAWFLIDFSTLLTVAIVVTALSWVKVLDPLGVFIYTALWMVLTGVPLLICATALALLLSKLWGKTKDRNLGTSSS